MIVMVTRPTSAKTAVRRISAWISRFCPESLTRTSPRRRTARHWQRSAFSSRSSRLVSERCEPRSVVPIGSTRTRAHCSRLAVAAPDEVVRRLEGMIRPRNPEVIVERRATEEEVQQIEVREARTVRRPHYISEPIGRVAGIESLYPENDVRCEGIHR
jgi:hypothetical protein